MNNIAIGTGSGGVGTSKTTLGVEINLDSELATIFDAELYNAHSPATAQLLTLASGANTISATNCPAIASAGGVVLVPPSGNTIAVTLKGISGDTGIALSLTAPTFLSFAVVPPTSFVLNAGSQLTGYKFVWI